MAIYVQTILNLPRIRVQYYVFETMHGNDKKGLMVLRQKLRSKNEKISNVSKVIYKKNLKKKANINFLKNTP